MGLLSNILRGRGLRPEARDDEFTISENGDSLVKPVENDLSNHFLFPYQKTITSVDAGDYLGAVSISSDKKHLIFNPGAAYDYLATGEVAMATLSYTVRNAWGQWDRAEITLTIEGANDAPDANDVTATVNEDSAGILIAADFTDVDAGDTHTIAVDTTGTLGTVSNNGDGTFSYDPSGQFESVAAGETATDSFSYSVDDGNGGVSTATVNVTITGDNDAVMIEAADATGAVTEDEADPALTTSGTIEFSDPDGTDIHTASAVYASSTHTSQLGSMSASVTEAGVVTWDYTVDNDAVQFLGEGVTVTEVYAVTIDDGEGGAATHNVTITITGVNDFAIVRGTSGTTLLENGAALFETTVPLSVIDPDAGESGFQPVVDPADLIGTYGTFGFDETTGHWSYMLDAGSPEVEGLAEGDLVSDIVSVYTIDGREHSLTVEVRGENDAPVGMDDTIGGETFFPLGGDRQVNTETANAQTYSNVAALADGGFVVTWTSHSQDGSGSGVYGQLHDASGAQVGPEFLVNTTTNSDQTFSAVAGLDGGGFVVTWSSLGQDGSGTGVYGQLYGASGAPVGPEFAVHTNIASEQTYPSVAAFDGGGFVVTWSNSSQDGSGWGIYGQLFDAGGAQVGPEFAVNTTTNNHQIYSNVTTLEGGGFVVTWQSQALDGSDFGIAGQLYDASGMATGTEFVINTETSGSQSNPSVAALEGGGFVVTWSSRDQDGSGFGVYGQRYDASGAQVGTEFAINTTTAGQQFLPSVAALDGGGFVVTWQSLGQDGWGWGIYGQRFDASGTAVDGEFRLNSITTGNQATELFYGGNATAVLEDGTVVSTWSSTTGTEEVFVRLFAPALTDEDTAVTIDAADLLANDTDVEGDTLSITAVLNSANGALVTLNGDGSVTYDPTGSAVIQALGAGDSLTDTFTYFITDGQLGDRATVSVNVTGTNDAPTTSAVDLGSIAEDGFGRVIDQAELLANANDVDGDMLNVTNVQIATGNGTLSMIDAVTWHYTPALNDDGDVSFSYDIADGADTVVGSASLDITPVNDAPVAVADDFTAEPAVLDTIPQDASAVGPTSDASVFFQTFTADSDILNAVTVGTHHTIGTDAMEFHVLVTTYTGNGSNLHPDEVLFDSGKIIGSGPGDGDVFSRVETGGLRLEEGQNYAIVMDFSSAQDGEDGGGNILTTHPNDAIPGHTFYVTSHEDPVSEDRSAMFARDYSSLGTQADLTMKLEYGPLTDEDTAATIDAADLLVNDSDVDNDHADLTIGSVSGTSALGAVINIDGSGNVVYDPTGSATLQALAGGEMATDTFTYTAFDGTDNSDPVTVTLSVAGANDAPVAADDFYSGGASNSELDTLQHKDTYVYAAGETSFSVSYWGQTFTADAGGLDAISIATYFDTASGNDPIEFRFLIVEYYTAGRGFFPTDILYQSEVLTGASPDAIEVTTRDETGGVDLVEGTRYMLVIDFISSFDGNPGGGWIDLTSTESDRLPDETMAYSYSLWDNPEQAFEDGLHGGAPIYDNADVAMKLEYGAPAVTDEDTPITIGAAGLLANDTDVDNDHADLTIGAVSGTSALGAVVSIDGSGNLVYDPTGSAALEALENGEKATDTFTYTAFDGTDQSDPVTVELIVGGVTDRVAHTIDFETPDTDFFVHGPFVFDEISMVSSAVEDGGIFEIAEYPNLSGVINSGTQAAWDSNTVHFARVGDLDFDAESVFVTTYAGSTDVSDVIITGYRDGVEVAWLETTQTVNVKEEIILDHTFHGIDELQIYRDGADDPFAFDDLTLVY